MALLNDLQTFLIAQGFGVAPGDNDDWSIFIRDLPDDVTAPDQSIGLFSLPGRAPEGTNNVSYPRVSIYIRTKPFEADAAEAKHHTLYNLLHGTFNSVGSDYVSFLAIESEPMDLGKDSKNRQVLSRTFDVIKHVT